MNCKHCQTTEAKDFKRSDSDACKYCMKLRKLIRRDKLALLADITSDRRYELNAAIKKWYWNMDERAKNVAINAGKLVG